MSLQAGTTVGPYRLQVRLGRGSAGEVWRASAEGCSVPVAVKVLRAREEDRFSWLTEVRAVARLQHPCIQPVLDAGTDGELAFMVGELASGTLREEREELAWPELKALVAQLLGALAHAHARGVTHRDLKPGNVLFRDVRGQRLWRLTDFGVADLGRAPSEGTAHGSTGTPLYMAPEQVRGEWRHQGPWTDLYALGCVVHEVAGWGHPFAGLLPVEIMARQLRAALPPLDPAFDVPDGLSDWVARCVAARPEDRFQRASEALEALLALDSGAVEVPAPPPPPLIPGAGLSLLSLRQPPLVGRDAERTRLLEALRQAPRTVVLRGPAGVGKSRLARWICAEAHERGASLMWATFAPDPGPHDGLAAMIERDVRGGGLSGAELVPHLAARVEPGDARAVAALLRPGDDVGVDLASHRERLGAVRRYLAAEVARRPVVVWLDDVQWGAEGLELVPMLSELPVLVVATARDEALLDRPHEARLLEALDAEVVPVGPLDDAAARALVTNLVALEPRLVTRVAAAAGGHPLFAEQLVRSWVEAGLLEPGPEGFVLAAGARVALPDHATTLWRERVDAALAGAGAEAVEIGAVLGLRVDAGEWRAACAEAGVGDLEEGVEALARRGLGGRHRDGSWVWTHRMLQEAALQRVRDSGRLKAWSRACAAAVDPAADPARAARFHLDAGHHDEGVDLLLKAAILATQRADPVRALGLIAERAEALDARGVPAGARVRLEADVVEARLQLGRGEAARAIALVDRAVAGAAAGGHDDVLADALCARSVLGRRAGRPEDARADSLRARALFEACGDAVGVARTLGLEADVCGADEARPLVQAAVAALDADPRARDSVLRANMITRLGVVAAKAGQRDEAVARYREALAVYERLGQRGMQAQMWAALGAAAEEQGDVALAVEYTDRALALLAQLDQRTSSAIVTAAAALLHLRAGRLDRAEALARHASGELLAVGLHDRYDAEAVLIAVLARTGRLAEARAVRDRLRRRAERTHIPGVEATLRLADLALAEDAEAWDAAMGPVEDERASMFLSEDAAARGRALGRLP